ncbi:LacI family DNA-binding transcriptional regulator [Paeniglutamicibacter gangotriensis]|uniref:LacI family transcriptional regulator n=2 Tax=Paeniglutamicibacter gangotriensis TaxID=254787 RepID=M7N7M2_9MICC|nr:LacI family DNA-binding transcriptional regulator [Paeniglutamicibacter gangotriensis]EMQ97754.1 LacI family transcriptional regulator [Paeniglutamicibacter gangotriensis Lz1y]KAA0979055.1 LacI family transcriptional regulator [Paeniglutamicibacter gangotriensis]
MASIKDVALRAGVSVATVSRALSGNGKVSVASRQAVQQAAKELGYVLSYNASSLASGRSRNIGIVMPTVSRWYYANVLQGATQELNERGYDLTLYNTSGEQRHRDAVFQDLLMRQRLDAVITVTLKLTAPELHQLRAVKKPLVALGGLLPEVDTIRVDDFNIASLATEHLISLGHTRLAFLGGADVFNVDFNLPAARLDGFEYALDQADLAVNPQWLLDSDFTMAGAYQKVRSLLSNPRGRPTALLCASDEMAFGAIMAARDLGLSLPGDFSVIGIDGHELGELFGLTTLAQFPAAQGEAAVARIMDLLGEGGADAASGTPPADDFFPTEFVLRTSTAPPATT